MINAAIYCRYSTDNQRDSSIEQQDRDCVDYIKRQGWKLAGKFLEPETSGETEAERPVYQKMKAAALAGRFSILVIEDPERLARGVQLGMIIKEFEFHRVRVVTRTGTFDSFSPTAMMQATISGMMSEEMRSTIRVRTKQALRHRAQDGFHTGGKAYGYDSVADGEKRRSVVVEPEAKVVKEIFAMFASGDSCRDIAGKLNDRGVPSPGASQDRKVRRSSGWMGSGIRAILRNDKYTGRIVWNRTQWKKHPVKGTYRVDDLPQAQWIVRQVEALRVVSDTVFAKAQKRFRPSSESKAPAAGGKPKYLLSGILKCGKCGASYTMADARSYSCGSYLNGKACDHGIRFPRLHAEEILLSGIRQQVLDPAKVEEMAAKLTKRLAEAARVGRTKADRSAELKALDEKLSRLRKRLKAGDPDLDPSDLAAAVERVEKQRRDLESAAASKSQIVVLPKKLKDAAARIRDQIDAGLSGDPRAAARARAVLREAFGGKVLIEERGRQVWASWNLSPSVLLRAEGTDGSGGRI